MILAHPKKEKVNSWSMATLDKLSSEKTNFGSGCVLGSPRRKETESKSSRQSAMKNVKQRVSHFLRLLHVLEKCLGRLWPFADSMNTSNLLLMNLVISTDHRKV